MSQQQIIDCLKKKEGLTAKEIADKINISVTNVNKNIQRLMKDLYGEIWFKTEKQIYNDVRVFYLK